MMTVKELDFIFPFVVFGYGAIVTFVLGHSKLVALAEKKLSSEMWTRFQSKRTLAFVCLVVGGLWSLQNLWF